jgi:outer membrane protein OmpA-like peptidoglycan-associated protein
LCFCFNPLCSLFAHVNVFLIKVVKKYLWAYSVALLLSLNCAITFNAQAALKLETDHPLMSRYQGATNFSNHVFDYAQTTLPVGVIDDREQTKNTLVVEGRISYIHYRLPKATSQFEAIKVIQQQIKKSQFSLLFECQQNDVTHINNCGEEMHYFARLAKVRGGFQFDCGNDEEFYLITAKLTRVNKKNSYLFICTEDGRVNQTIIDEKAFNLNQIKINSKNYHPDEKALSGVAQQTEEDKEGAKDHPLISRYPNSVITDYSTIDYGKAELPLQGFAYSDQEQVNKNKKTYYLSVDGKGSFIEYRLPNGLSQYQVLQNYLQALKANNIEIIFQCVGNHEQQCGDGLVKWAGVENIMPALANGDNCNDSGAAIITAKTTIAPNHNAYLYFCIVDSPWLTVSQTIIEEKPLKTGLITMSANELEQAIASKGKVAIYGILFNSDSDTIQQQSTPVIKQVAELLTQKPQLKLYVVGHTDGQGSEQYNNDLSTRRAQAVINALVKNFGIAKNRLQARGVGELVPVATNRAKEGRQLNRRVELVEM